MVEAMAALRVRRAQEHDAAVLARFAAALNAHLREPVEHMTEAAVRRDFLGSDSGLTTLVAEGAAIAGEAVRPLGYALHHVAYETAYAARGTCLIDLYVEEAVRRRGVGRALIAAVASETRARGGRFIWWVSKAWNVDAQQAYARLGAFSEPVVAHALFDEPFERLVDLTPSRGDGGA